MNPSDATETLSIIVTHYKTPELLMKCLTRLKRFVPEAVLIVVDSGAERGLEAALGQNFPEVTLLNVANHSMANGVNAGLKLAQTPYILQMNADVMIEADVLPAMLKELTKPGVGMVAPRCRTPEGTWQNQGLGYYINYALLDLSRRSSLSVPWLSGCCQMLKTGVLEHVGGMNSSLRFYNEDIEWCWRIRKAGYECRLIKESVLHIGGASTPEDAKFLLEGFRGGYVLSQRYKSPLYRHLHRRVLRLYASFKERTAQTLEERQTYLALLEMFREANFEESPFGATLDEDNPNFLRS